MPKTSIDVALVSLLSILNIPFLVSIAHAPLHGDFFFVLVLDVNRFSRQCLQTRSIPKRKENDVKNLFI